jgi:polyphosphate kinase 2 (PPK2 family)
MMSDYSKKFIVKPESKVRLKHFDAGYHGKRESHERALPEIQQHIEKMAQLQYLMYAERKDSLLVVLQGLHAAGEDGVVRHIFTGNPAGCILSDFKQPTPEELGHDFLWRVHPHVPAKGSVAIFNRSHYEDVLVAWRRPLSSLSFTFNPTWSVSLERAWSLVLSLEQELAGRWRTVLAVRS